MGFWTVNPFVPSWLIFLSNYWSSSPPKLLETLKSLRPVELPPGVNLRAAVVADGPAILEFWGRYFSNWPSCRCAMTAEHLKTMWASWEILLVVRQDGVLLGTVVRRRLRGLHVREARWAEAAAIDYFCVHPAWRKKGIGRALLNAIHNTGADARSAMPPQLIFWEGLRPSVPPLAAGFFWSRRGLVATGVPVLGEERRKAWRDCVKGVDVWTEEPGEEISVWLTAGSSAAGSSVVVWNTFHRSVPDGGAIGIVLAGDANALAAAGSPWAVLLVPSLYSPGAGWTLDSPFQWIGYNLSVGFVSGFPLIGF